MSMTQSETFAASGATNYGGFADAIGGIATVVLAIVALAGVNPGILVPVAVTVFGAALLVQGGAILSEHAHILFPAGTASAEPFKGGNLTCAGRQLGTGTAHRPASGGHERKRVRVCPP